MAHSNVINAAASTSLTRSRRPARLHSGGSFHAGAPIPSIDDGPSRQRRRSSLASSIRRQSTTQQTYQTFPTPPPKTPLNEMSFGPRDDAATPPDDSSASHSDDDDEEDDSDAATPLPLKQLGLLALLSLAEQTALNSISPYLPTMVASFPGMSETQTGLYVGLLASAFALAQLATNLLWGAACDRVGRKPVMLAGTALLAGCFAAFGFCTRYWHAVLVHAAMGLLNGNAAVVPTVLGELTDRSNQSRAFTWLPVMYSIGGITGPALGGLLVPDDWEEGSGFPFLAPNVTSAVLLFLAVIVLAVWFEETLEEADRAPAWFSGQQSRWLETLRRWFCCGRSRKPRGRLNSWSSRWPTRSQDVPGLIGNNDQEDDDDDVLIDEEDDLTNARRTENQSLLHGRRSSVAKDNDDNATPPSRKALLRQLLNRTTILVLATYLVFQLSNISFNSLYPIFASSPRPTGLEMSPETIGLLLSFAGFTTILFQVALFQPLKARLGNLGTYRVALLGLAVSMALMPWVGTGTGDGWLYAELGIVLVVKNICAVGGLSSVMLLITNSAPSHETLGTLNGIAQTLSAAGRSVGPFVSGGLFSVSTRVPRGELLAWGIFAGIALVGWLCSITIRGAGLESADWVGDDDEDEIGDEESQVPNEDDSERTVRNTDA